MTSVADQEKVTLPVILAAIGGLLMLIGGFVSLTMISYHTMFGGHRMLGMMMGGGWQAVMPQISTWIIAMSVSSIILGGIVLFASYKIQSKPQVSKAYGTVILICSIVGLFFASGFWIGSVLGIIAGIIGISRK